MAIDIRDGRKDLRNMQSFSHKTDTFEKMVHLVGFTIEINNQFLSVECNLLSKTGLTFRCRIKSRLPFADIIRRLPYSTRFQDKG